MVFQDGVSVRADALRLLLALEADGCSIEVRDDHLVVGPDGWLSASDRQGIDEYHDQLVALVRMCNAIQEEG